MPVRLYQPDGILRSRIGDDVGPLSDFLNALHATVTTFAATRPMPDAGGVLIAVGIKPTGAVRAWCQAVDGTIPAPTLAALESAVAAVPPPPVAGGPVAFSMEFELNGRSVASFPRAPVAWGEAAERAGRPVVVPDGVFEILWPDPTA